MSTKDELIAEQFAGVLQVQKRWGTLFINPKDYGAFGDGIKDDTNAFIKVEADPCMTVMLPEGTYVVNGINLTKRYIGPGKIKLNGTMMGSTYTVIRSLPATGANPGDYFGGDQRRTDAQSFEIASTVNASTVTSNYYNWELQPHLSNFTVNSGYSGFTTKTTGVNNIGQPVVNVRNTTDLAAGMKVLVGPDIYTIQTVNSIGQVTMTTNLVATYAVNTGVTKGNRTMFDDYFSNLYHFAGGDAYSYMSRVVAAKLPDTDQSHFSWNSTAGIIGGDLTGVADGVYLTGSEMNFIDTNFTGSHDIAVVGDVKSFQRTNATGARGAVWVGTLYKSEGTQYCEGAHVVTGKWKGGLDLVWADFGSNQAAIKLAPNQRIYFNGTAVADEAGYQMWSSNPGNTSIGYNSGLGQFEVTVGATLLSAWTPTNFYSTKQINVPVNTYINLNNGLTVTGIVYDGTNIKIMKNGVQVAIW